MNKHPFLLLIFMFHLTFPPLSPPNPEGPTGPICPGGPGRPGRPSRPPTPLSPFWPMVKIHMFKHRPYIISNLLLEVLKLQHDMFWKPSSCKFLKNHDLDLSLNLSTFSSEGLIDAWNTYFPKYRPPLGNWAFEMTLSFYHESCTPTTK